MALSVKIPALNTSNDTFVVSVHNDGPLVLKAPVTLTVTAKAPGSVPARRKFSIDGAQPPKEDGDVDLEGHKHTRFTVSDWGAAAEGDTVQVTVAGKVSNTTVVVETVNA